MNNKKIPFEFNKYGVKDSCFQYRNINGVHYQCYASDPETFDGVIKEAKEKGLRYKIIKGELYLEIKD